MPTVPRRWVFLLALMAAGCVHHVPPREPSGEVGVASFYAESLAGRPTASGEKFDPKAMTCAHRTLPFGTWLRVTNMGNGLAVEVRVNDRGPFVRGRVLDLSPAAARVLGFRDAGTAMVRIEVIRAGQS